MRYWQSTYSVLKCVSGLALLFLLLFLTGCGQNPSLPEVPRTERLSPPASLLLTSPIPDFSEVKTNWDLLELARRLRSIALSCMEDKNAIAAWSRQEAGGKTDSPSGSDSDNSRP